MKLGQAVLALIDGNLWDRTYWVMEDSPLGLAIIPHQDRKFPHYLEVGPFMSDIIFPPTLGSYLWADEELMFAGEVVDVLKGEVVDLSCVVM